jgi:hypothetical protein
LALTGIRVVTQDFGRNPSCSYVRPVVTRGSSVYTMRQNAVRDAKHAHSSLTENFFLQKCIVISSLEIYIILKILYLKIGL